MSIHFGNFFRHQATKPQREAYEKKLRGFCGFAANFGFGKIKKFILAVFFLAVAFGSASAQEFLEQPLTPENTKIGFTLDSTLHVIHGSAPKFQGSLRFPLSQKPEAFHAQVAVPVKDMVTGNDSRDEKMRDYCFEMKKYPEIRFESTGVENLPPSLEKGKDFEFTLKGNLTIKDVTREISIPVKGATKDDGLHLSGKVMLNYLKDFNIKDPSVLLFRVAKEVEVSVEVNLPEFFKGK